MDMVEAIFESQVRVKLLKLFLMNPDSEFTLESVAALTKLRPQKFSGELRRLIKLGLIKSIQQKFPVSEAKAKTRFTFAKVFSPNKDFPLFPELRLLMVKSAPHSKGQLSARIKRLGNIKLAILAGVFIDNPNSRADMLLVGDSFNKGRMRSFIQWLEAEVGKELNYVVMSSQEFKYRMDMYDRFVRDILEFPHEKVINKLVV